jgi:hypothetical protein
MLLEAIKFVTEQDKAPKDTLFLFHLLFQSNLDLKFNIIFFVAMAEQIFGHSARSHWNQFFTLTRKDVGF